MEKLDLKVMIQVNRDNQKKGELF